MRNFPQELFDSVVDFVQDDRPTLATVRLVSHAWNISARLHLFRSLDLMISEPLASAASPHSSGRHLHLHKARHTGIEKFKSLLSLLEISADISHCVRHVSLGRTTSFSSTDTESHKQQTTYAALISSILSHFSHLSDVVFREMNWATLAPSFVSCILQICKTRTLERIEIWNCQMPTASVFLDFLGASRNVKGLRLSHFRLLTVDIEAEESNLSSSATTAGEDRAIGRPCDTKPCTSLLHSLAVDAAPDAFVLHNLLGIRPHSVNFLKLRRLYLGNVNDTVVAEFLQKVGHSLEFLDLRLIPSNQIQPRLSDIQFDLSHCPRLQHLRVSGLHWTPSLCPSEYLSSLFAKTRDRSLPIESLQLMVIVLKPKVNTPVANVNRNRQEAAAPPALCRPTELHYADWSILDTVLSSHVFHALKAFQISIKTIRERDADPSRLSDMFPKLRNNGVQVTCT